VKPYGRKVRHASVSRARPFKRVAKRRPKKAITAIQIASFVYGQHKTLVQASRRFGLPQAEIKKRLLAKKKRAQRRAITVQTQKIFTDKKVGQIRTRLMKQKKDVQLHKWKGGPSSLDNDRSTGKSIRFSVRKRLTPGLVEQVLYRIDRASMQLSRHGFPFWTTLMSHIVMGHSKKLPGYQPLNLKGLPKGSEGYVSYGSTGIQASRMAMLVVARRELEDLADEPVYISLEQVSVSTYKHKTSAERVEFLAARQKQALATRKKLRRALKRKRSK
jgi:hypothetical protein